MLEDEDEDDGDEEDVTLGFWEIVTSIFAIFQHFID